jgi:hypothetical protein
MEENKIGTGVVDAAMNLKSGVKIWFFAIFSGSS